MILKFNDIVQGGGVVLALALCAGWIIRRIIRRRKDSNEGSCCDDGKELCTNDNSGCAGCPLSQNCNKH